MLTLKTAPTHWFGVRLHCARVVETGVAAVAKLSEYSEDYDCAIVIGGVSLTEPVLRLRSRSLAEANAEVGALVAAARPDAHVEVI